MGVWTLWGIVAILIAASWYLPRTLGLLGMLAAHYLAIAGSFMFLFVAIHVGVWADFADYDGITTIFIGAQVLLQAFLFNCLMLPLSIWAMRQWQRKSPMSPVRDRYTQPETTAHN